MMDKSGIERIISYLHRVFDYHVKSWDSADDIKTRGEVLSFFENWRESPARGAVSKQNKSLRALLLNDKSTWSVPVQTSKKEK